MSSSRVGIGGGVVNWTFGSGTTGLSAGGVSPKDRPIEPRLATVAIEAPAARPRKLRRGSTMPFESTSARDLACWIWAPTRLRGHMPAAPAKGKLGRKRFAAADRSGGTEVLVT